MTIKVLDLKDQTGHPELAPHPILHCTHCQASHSANAGDYWNVSVDHIFTCCGEPMQLGHMVTQFKPI